MSTAHMNGNFDGDAVLTADGPQVVAAVESDGCCAEPLCAPTCDIVCSFIDLLPDGPMWNQSKDEARARANEGGDYDPCNPVCFADRDCAPSMPKYAAYLGGVFKDLMSQAVWTSIRESDPLTAVSTQDDWLLRMGWRDCYDTACAHVTLDDDCLPACLRELAPGCVPSQAKLTNPFWGHGPDGPEYGGPAVYPEKFTRALKHAILAALVRRNRGVIKNLDGINWVIEPLGAVVRPRTPWPDNVQCWLDKDEYEDAEEENSCFCNVAEFEICVSSAELPAAPNASSPCTPPGQPVTMKQQFFNHVTQEYVTVVPSVLAAECIVQTLLPTACPTKLYRCTEFL